MSARRSVVYDGQTYPNLSSACKAAGVRLRAVQSRQHNAQEDVQTAFDHVVSRSSCPQWTAEDLKLLAESYPLVGASIPLLAEKFSRASIISKAAAKGIHFREDRNVILDGEKLGYYDALRILNVNSEAARSIKTKFNLNKQQVIDRILLMRAKQEDGTYIRLAQQVSGLEEEYIHHDGKWWSPSIYCEQHSDLNVSTILNVRRSKKLSTQKAFEYLCATGATAESMLEAQGIAMRDNDIVTACNAYIGTDGRRYIFALCSVCHHVLLLSVGVAQHCRHGELCGKCRVPNDWVLPRDFCYSVKRVLSDSMP